MKQDIRQISEARQIAGKVRESRELWDLMEDLLTDMIEGSSMVPWESRLRDLLDSETVAHYQRPDRNEIEGRDE